LTNPEVALLARGGIGKRPLTRRRMAATLSPGRGQEFSWRAPRAEILPLPWGEGGRGTRSGEGSFVGGGQSPLRGQPPKCLGLCQRTRVSTFVALPRCGPTAYCPGFLGSSTLNNVLAPPRATVILSSPFRAKDPGISSYPEAPREGGRRHRGARALLPTSNEKGPSSR